METDLEQTAEEIKDKYENNQVKVIGKESMPGAKKHDTPTALLRAWGPGLFLWQKAAVRLGRAFLAKNKLAEADIHFEFTVIMERNITIFRQN